HFNGSTVREPWLSAEQGGAEAVHVETSMGPRFANRGYPLGCPLTRTGTAHFNGSTVREPWLSRVVTLVGPSAAGTSMGPRFANRGYPRSPRRRCSAPA